MSGLRPHKLALLAAAVAVGLAARAGEAPPATHAPARAAPARAAPAQAPPGGGRVYWGAWIGKHLTGTDAPWSTAAITKFEALAGKDMSLIEFSSPWHDCRSGSCVPYPFPRDVFDVVRRHGAIPVFSWGSNGVPILQTRRAYRLAAITRGRYDAYIRQWALDAKRWGHPFFLRFDWEMNGDWFPWSEGINGNKPGEFVKMWRHVHDIFTSVGATKVTWMWCPNADYALAGTPVRVLYPGNRYVDWTCVDGYNRQLPWRSFAAIFGSTYDLLRGLAPAKPIAVGEVGSMERGGSKAAWITGMFRDLQVRFPKVRALVWFEKYDSGIGAPIETSKSSAAAFRRGIASRRYVADEYYHLRGGPVRPPR